MPTSTLNQLKIQVSTYATQTLGFDDCRFCDPRLEGELDETRDWLAQGFHGDMKYLEDHLKFKENPDLLLRGVKSAIVLIKNYKNTSIRQLTGEFKIARYAVGKDYHLVMKEKLEELANFIKREDPSIECYSGVDSRPLAERSLALKAGIGFRGKNTMVIKPGLGSYFFIGVILTNHSFENDTPLNWNCGQCRLCLDACPTGAFKNLSFGGDNSYFLDATKCISYMTIEQKNFLTQEELEKTNGWLFGCDICQEVCPYNHGRTPLTDWKEFQPEAGVGFDFFARHDSIPKDTSLYRSRKRVVPNWHMACQTK